MKCVAISDTHNRHHQFKSLPEGDILIHAGDFTMGGSIKEIHNFIEWFSKQDYKHKIFIAGNHDIALESMSSLYVKDVLLNGRTDIHYLLNSSVEIEGVKFWGSPYSSKFGNWAFMGRQDYLSSIWDSIPDDADVLIVHGPPFGILDRCYDGHLAGCPKLLNRMNKINYKVGIFGHIHESYGYKMNFVGKRHYNVSSCTLQYKLDNEPVVFEI